MTLISYYNYLILNLYKNFKDNNIELDYYKLAKIYEYYTCIKLEEEYDELFYEYDIMPPEFKENNNLSKYDSGIDCCNLVDTIVQCKLRKKSLNWGECATFFASQNSYCSNKKETIIKWNKLIISRNDNIKLSKNLEMKKNIFIDKLYNVNEVIEYCDNLYNNIKINKYLKSNKDIKLRDYQIEAINIIKQSNKNVIISLPTGTGKNIVIINSLEYGKKYLILVPRIILMDQLKDIIIQYYPQYKSIIQCIGSKSNMFNDDKLITISVYNSINHIEPYKYDFDKIFIDEAHHIYTPEIYQSDNYNEDYKELTYIDKN
jgi:primosomal protein N'